ncbi:MAG: alpha/beta fold hydrolase [Chloroflexota bacterium]|nr:alpha/beta hydrolase [Dehalococcoidia bacterium]MDW8252375.1 alpha/beta fold hydrolase [Chloroflexota bacterium]
MARVRRGYLAAPTGRIHYRHAGPDGDDAPALVLFHESPLSSVIFERALPLLGERLRVWAFDTPGYGLSDPPPAPLEIPEYARWLLQGIDALGIDRFAAGGGHTGASLAIEVAALAGPERVSCVILSGVPLLAPEERAEYLANWAPEMVLDADGAYLRWAWERYQRIWGPDDPALNTLAIIQLLQVWDRYSWAYNAAFRHDPAPSLATLACPILLLNSEDDLLNFTDPRALELAPHAKLVRVPGLRGQLPWRRPEVYADETIAFILGEPPRFRSAAAAEERRPL